jgi:hypothetical protein
MAVSGAGLESQLTLEPPSCAQAPDTTSGKSSLSCFPAEANVFSDFYRSKTMSQFVIERTLPGAGKMSDTEMQQISAKSNDVLHGMTAEGTPIQWLKSYVTGDKLYCVYNAPDANAIEEHAKRGGFPIDSVAQVARVIDPASALNLKAASSPASSGPTKAAPATSPTPSASASSSVVSAAT